MPAAITPAKGVRKRVDRNAAGELGNLGNEPSHYAIHFGLEVTHLRRESNTQKMLAPAGERRYRGTMAGSKTSGSLVVAPGVRFNGVKVFSATMFAQRDALGDAIADWIARHPQCTPTEYVVTQSSDSRFHCISIAVFYSELRR